jgi:hypothetical protein
LLLREGFRINYWFRAFVVAAIITVTIVVAIVTVFVRTLYLRRCGWKLVVGLFRFVAGFIVIVVVTG